MTYVVEFRDPTDNKYYTEYIELKIIVDAFLAVLERRGMQEIRMFEE